MSGYSKISSIRKMAAALPMKPILEVFSRRCGVSETTEAGMAIEIFFLLKLVFRLYALEAESII
jgi:hypothetical protein